MFDGARQIRFSAPSSILETHDSGIEPIGSLIDDRVIFVRSTLQDGKTRFPVFVARPELVGTGDDRTIELRAEREIARSPEDFFEKQLACGGRYFFD